MKNILILGAGLSSSTLIRYLLQKSKDYQWSITVADMDLATAERKINGFENGKAVSFNINDEEHLADLINQNDLVISMMPAALHPVVAQQCLKFSKHLFTASYVSPQMKSFDQEAKSKTCCFSTSVASIGN